jgi:hypothetical protein
MTAQTRNLWRVVVVLGAVFAILNLTELVFRDRGWPEVVGLMIGVALVGLGLARSRGLPEVGDSDA